jgi:hypothetical protein
VTPEGRIKKAVKDFLYAQGVSSLARPCNPSYGYYIMPVPAGIGSSTLDFIGCCRGVFFAIETKAPGGKLTARQKVIAEMILTGAGYVFIVFDIDEFKSEWTVRIGRIG